MRTFKELLSNLSQFKKAGIAVGAGLALTALVSACTSEAETQAQSSATSKASESKETLTIYKSPTCGCCQLWVDHIGEYGFSGETVHPQDLSAKKDELGVPAKARSCHTAVSKQGYVFEGHIPAKYIQQFLQSPPENALGLVVPGMPVGSPGMEVGNKFMPYDIFVFNKDGSSSVYANVAQAGDQF